MSVNLSNDGRKVWAAVLFLGAFMHSKVIYVNFVDFFLPYLQDHGLLRSRNFASMTVWRDDVSSLYLKRNGRVYEQVKGGFSLLLN